MATEAENIDMVVSALRKVPEKKLRIIDLANRIPIKNGELDPVHLATLQPEINLAIAEAKAYGNQTLQAIDSLIRVKAVPK